MNRIDAILETYRQADSATRMDLFMNHRDLRVLFDDIEAEDGAIRPAAASAVRVAGAFRDATVTPLA